MKPKARRRAKSLKGYKSITGKKSNLVEEVSKRLSKFDNLPKDKMKACAEFLVKKGWPIGKQPGALGADPRLWITITMFDAANLHMHYFFRDYEEGTMIAVGPRKEASKLVMFRRLLHDLMEAEEAHLL